eukprot:SAG31_NODE_1786_length_7271_cov_6.872492_1_plen_39_part_10
MVPEGSIATVVQALIPSMAAVLTIMTSELLGWAWPNALL